MPKNTKGGKKTKRYKNSSDKNTPMLKLNDIPTINDETETELFYGKVVKRFGGKFLSVNIGNNIEVTCYIPNKFYKRVWMNPDDFVLIQSRACDTVQNHYDVVYKYEDKEISMLRKNNIFDFNFDINKDDDDGLIFEKNNEFDNNELNIDNTDNNNDINFDDI